MNIRFDAGMMRKVQTTHRTWWAGQLDRPLVQVRMSTGDKWPEGVSGFQSFTAKYPDSLSAGEIVDSWQAHLERVVYIGDAFPQVWPNFGPGVMAAFTGAKLDRGESTVWFHPEGEPELADIKVEYDENNRWLKRVKDIVALANGRFAPWVSIGHTDLGGAMDVLSSFRPGDKLLMDLYDDPERVHQLEEQLSEVWWRLYEEFHGVTAWRNASSCWTPLLSEKKFYMLQSDFSYMIGPDMFVEFVLPRLARWCALLDHAFYHLDGVGQLPHLDHLLALENLKGIQWVPGAGQPPEQKWPEVYGKIVAAGKLAQISFTGVKGLREFADNMDGLEKMAFIGWITPAQEKEMMKLLDELNVPV